MIGGPGGKNIGYPWPAKFIADPEAFARATSPLNQ
jgi:hypothetical protein